MMLYRLLLLSTATFFLAQLIALAVLWAVR